MRRLLFATALSLASCVAYAQSPAPRADIEQQLTAEEMHEAGLDTLTPAQLAALNRLLREKAAPANAAANVSTAGTSAAPRSYVGLDDQPIRSKVKGTVSGWEPGTVFVLENGQQWKVLKGQMKLRKPLEHPAIMVIPGFAGRWFLQVDEDMPKARVYRID